ncbi:hypothetical protein PWT90_08407 [Aphanocladium album]|nr:hypothetical protein PWT90_08407 [Aphanocladium album]
MLHNARLFSAQHNGAIAGAQNSNGRQSSQPRQTRLQSPNYTLQIFLFKLWKMLPCFHHRRQQPQEVQNVTLTPTINHRRRPQPQEIRTGRDRALVEGLSRVNLFDAPQFAAYLKKVDSDSKALGCIERDLAVGLETEAGGPGHDCRVLKC